MTNKTNTMKQDEWEKRFDNNFYEYYYGKEGQGFKKLLSLTKNFIRQELHQAKLRSDERVREDKEKMFLGIRKALATEGVLSMSVEKELLSVYQSLSQPREEHER